METKYKSGCKTDIKIIGKFQTIYKQHSNSSKQPNAQSLDYRSIKLDSIMGVYCPQLQKKPQNYRPIPKKIYVQGNLIAFIDQLQNLWFVSSIFPNNINVSVILGRKIKNVSLSQNQCIINNKRNPILFNWGAKKIIDVTNMQPLRINQKMNKKIGNYFTAYSISQSSKDDKFLYSNIKKVDNSNKLYQLNSQIKINKHDQFDQFDQISTKYKNITYQQYDTSNYQIHSIIAYPTLEKNIMKNKVIGISVGKFHCMCWDIFGLLYTWGNRSLALGYEQLPHQKITSKPKLVTKMTKFVTMAFAATHYSLALSSDGNIYEWGIKKLPNQLNEQLIFDPKILKISQKNYKIVMLKGKNQQIACLNSKHQLYIWGQNTTKFISKSINKSSKFQHCIIYQPFLISNLNVNWKIIDFGIGDQFIALLTSNSDSMVMGEEEKMYWDGLLKRVKGKLKLSGPIKTQKSQQIQVPKQKHKLQRLKTMIDRTSSVPLLDFNQNIGQSSSIIQKSYQQRNIKRQYFKSLKNQKQLYINLLKNNNKLNYQFHHQKQINIRISNLQVDVDKQNYIKQTDNQNNQICQINDKVNVKNNKNQQKKNKIIKHCQKRNTSLNSTLNQTKIYLNTMFSQTIRKVSFGRKASIDFQNLRRKSQIKQFKKFPIQPYEFRLEKVQKKKKYIDDQYYQQLSKTIQENSIQYRMLRHNQILIAKTNAKHHYILKNTLQAYLIKHFVIKILTTPIEQARNIKIQQFSKTLQLSRIERNLRKIFIKNRVNSRLKKLKPSTYNLLYLTFNQYIKRRREKHSKQKKKLISQQIYKFILQQRIKQGLSKIQLSIKKLQKFRQWLVITKIQRIKCLRILWKNYLPQVMKVTHDSDAIIIYKVQDNCTFQSLYKDKILNNPMLKLQTFLNKTPIFSIKYQIYQNLNTFYKKDTKIKSQKTVKNIRTDRRKQRIKFNSNQQKQHFVNLYNGQNNYDLLPYSLHYNNFIRPKSMQVNILQNMKKNDQWIQIQRTILNKCLQQIIQNHQKQFVKTKNIYDIQLAYFIKEKYDILAQKRWKCVVQFNQLKQASKKQKKQKQIKEKQLYRLFDLIGMQKTLKQDCLPQKYLMLDEALKKKDGPQPPNPYIVFGLGQFKIILKKYYENISVQAKQMRSKYM